MTNDNDLWQAAHDFLVVVDGVNPIHPAHARLIRAVAAGPSTDDLVKCVLRQIAEILVIAAHPGFIVQDLPEEDPSLLKARSFLSGWPSTTIDLLSDEMLAELKRLRGELVKLFPEHSDGDGDIDSDSNKLTAATREIARGA